MKMQIHKIQEVIDIRNKGDNMSDKRKDEKDEMVTQSYLLENGWTKAMISKLLPEPLLKRNYMYRNASPIKLWNKVLVEEIMQTDAYIEATKKAQARREASMRGVETKKKNLLADINNLLDTIEVEVISDEKLVPRVLNDKRAWYEMHGDIFLKPDDITLRRWIVNYIRHELVSYDEYLYEIYGKTGKQDAYVILKNGILEKIAVAYPKYKEECRLQMI